MKMGAVDFTKPVDEFRAARRRRVGLAAGAARWIARAEHAQLTERHSRLTPREREVCALVAGRAVGEGRDCVRPRHLQNHEGSPGPRHNQARRRNGGRARPFRRSAPPHSEYTIRYGGPEMVHTPELKQFDQSARAWLSGAQFDRMTGNSLVNTIDRVAQQTHKMTPEQLQFFGESAICAPRTILWREARREIDRRPAGWWRTLRSGNPGLKQLLKSNGIGDQARSRAC